MPLDPRIPLMAAQAPQALDPFSLFLQMQRLQQAREEQAGLAEERQMRAQEIATSTEFNRAKLEDWRHQQGVTSQAARIAGAIDSDDPEAIRKMVASVGDPELQSKVMEFVQQRRATSGAIDEIQNLDRKRAANLVRSLTPPGATSYDPTLVETALRLDRDPRAMKLWQYVQGDPAKQKALVDHWADYGDKPEMKDVAAGHTLTRVTPGGQASAVYTAPGTPTFVKGWLGPNLVEAQRDPQSGRVTYLGQDVTARWQPLEAQRTPSQQIEDRLHRAQATEAEQKVRDAAAANALFGGAAVGAPAPVGPARPPVSGQAPSAGPAGPPVSGQSPPSGGQAPGATSDPDYLFGAVPQRNEAYLQTLPPQAQNLLRGISAGKQPYPTGRAFTSPLGQQIVSAINLYDPSFDQANAGARMKTRNAFTSGTEAKQVNALNTALGHLSELTDAVTALKNSDYPDYNRIANNLKTRIGWTGQTDFKTIAPRVVQEITRLWRGAGGAEADIDRDLETLDPAMAPKQLYSSISKTAHMMEDKLHALESQYAQGMGTAPVRMLDPGAQQTLRQLENLLQGGGAAGSASSGPLQRPIPGIPGGVAESTDGGRTWKRVK